MNKNLVVEVFVPVKGTEGQEGNIATGYPVGKDLILTARHPLYPQDAKRDDAYPIEVRWPHHPDVDPECWWPVDEIAWDGSDAFDVALLRCAIPAAIRERGTLTPRRPQSHKPWESHGLPRIGGRKNAKRVAFPMKGEVFGMADPEPTFQVDVDAGPKDRQKWGGASGSPIVTADGIIGVLVSVPDDLDAERFKVVPAWKLLQEETFRKLVEPAAPHLDLRRKVAEILQDADRAMAALQEALPDTEFPTPGHAGRGERFADQLLDYTPETLTKALRCAHLTLCERHQREAADTVVELAQAVLPAVFDSPAVEVVRLQRFDCNAVLLEIDAATPTVAEIVMARAEPRKARFKPASSPGQAMAPAPAYAVPHPPNRGMEPRYEQAARDIEAYLEEKFIRPEDDPILTSEGHRRQMVANKLRRESKERRTRYVAFRFRQPGDKEAARASLGTLKARYPELVLLDLSTDQDRIVEQRDLFDDLFERILNPPEEEA